MTRCRTTLEMDIALDQSKRTLLMPPYEDTPLFQRQFCQIDVKDGAGMIIQTTTRFEFIKKNLVGLMREENRLMRKYRRKCADHATVQQEDPDEIINGFINAL